LTSRVFGIACSVFQKEIEMLREQGKLTIPFIYLNSALHMKPAKLRDILDREVSSYPGAFAQVFTNLLLNSLVHGFPDQEGGHIAIDAEMANGHLRIRYSDDGRGIPADILPKIFDPFFTTNMQVGTGLGMHILFNIVTQKLGGTVTCESEVGQGTVFTINIAVTS